MKRLVEEWTIEDAAPRPSDEPSPSAVARALTRSLAGWLRRWVAHLAVCFLAGWVPALLMRAHVADQSWARSGQAAGFVLGLVGVLMGIMIAYGGRPAGGMAGPSHADSWFAGDPATRFPPRPVVGLCITLFCLPTLIASLTI
jgi:hypothetical protein